MQILIRLFLVLTLMGTIFVFCSIQDMCIAAEDCLSTDRIINRSKETAVKGSAKIKRSELPEEIYLYPEKNIYSPSRVVVKPFGCPDYASNLGEYAAQSLYRHLLQKKVFYKTVLDLYDYKILNRTKNNPDCISEYDLIITGDVVSYLDGGTLQDSKVIMEIRVYERTKKSNQLLWFARSTELGHFRPPVDLIFLQIPGSSSPSGLELMHRCTKKFANLLQANLYQKERISDIKNCWPESKISSHSPTP